MFTGINKMFSIITGLKLLPNHNYFLLMSLSWKAISPIIKENLQLYCNSYMSKYREFLYVLYV